MEHLRCSTMLMKWVAAMAATTTTGEHAAAACHRPSSPPNEALAVATTPMPSAKLATADERRTSPSKKPLPRPPNPPWTGHHRCHPSHSSRRRRRAHSRSVEAASRRSFNRRFSPKPQQPISGHLVFSVHANEPPSASRTQQAIQQHAHERHLHAGQQQRPFCTISSSPPSSRSNGKHLAPAEPISRRPIRPCTIAHESTATAARSCPFSIKFPAVRSVLITKQPWPDLDGHDRSNRRLAAPHDVSS
ncbi:hypothetical protein ACLOJK_037653 [Asimina triloba]